MELPLKSHQLLSHWVPGLVVLMFLAFLHFDWNYIKFTDVVAKQGSVASVSILLLAVAAFIIGEFIDAIRDLTEDWWNQKPKYKIINNHLHTDGADLQVRENYWTYYVLCYNLVVASLLCVIGLLIKVLLSNVVDNAKIGIWIVIVIAIVAVFLFDAISLRKEISEITQKKETDKGPTIDNMNKLPHDGVYTRLRSSKIHGIGVFAIRVIPRGTYIFPGDNSKMVWVNKKQIENIEPEIKRLYDDFCVIDGDRYHCPDNFNNLNVGWYLNESRDNSNIRCDENLDFYALRDIQVDEELTVDYSTFSDDPE